MAKSEEPPTPKTPQPVMFGPWRHTIARMQDPKANYPRLPTPANIWRRTPKAKAAIQTETKRRAEAENFNSNTPQAQAQGKIFVLREAVVRDLFDSLGEEEKKRWKVKAKEEHDRKVREWEDLVKPSEDPKVRQMYIDGLTDFVKAYIEVLSKATGCAVSFIGGGPEPAMGGHLNVVGVHQGHIPDHPELNFATFDPEAYKEKVVKPFGRLLRRCYTKEDCEAMALPIDPHSQTQPGSVLQSAIEPSIDITVGPIDFDDPAYEDNEEDWGETWDVEEGFTGENAKMNMLINGMHIEEVSDDEDEDGGGEDGDSMFSRYITSFPEMEGAGASSSPGPSIIPDHVSGTSLKNPTPTPSASASANSQTSSSSSSPADVAVPTSAVPNVPASASALDNPSNPNPNLNSISAPSLSPSPQPQPQSQPVPVPVPVISPPTPNPDVDMRINVGVGVDADVEVEVEMDVDIDVDANMDMNIPTSTSVPAPGPGPGPGPGPALEPELELEDPSNSQRKVGPSVQVQSAGGGGGGSSSLQGEARSATVAAASTSESTTPAPDAAPVTVSPTPSLPSSSPASSLAVGSGGTGQVNSSPSPNSNSKSNGQKEGSSPARTQSQTLQSSPSSSSPASGAGGSDSPGAVALVLAPAAGSSNLTSTSKSTAPSNSAASSPAPSSATKTKFKPKPRFKVNAKTPASRRGDPFSFLFPSLVASSSRVTLDGSRRGSTTKSSGLGSGLGSSSAHVNVNKHISTSTTSSSSSSSSSSSRSPYTSTPTSRPTINGWPDYSTDENGNPRGLRITKEYLSESASKVSIDFDDPDEPLIPHILITAPSPPRNTPTTSTTSTVPNALPRSPSRSPSDPIFRLIHPAPSRQVISDKDRLMVPPRSYKRQHKAEAVLPPTPTSSPVTTGTGASAGPSSSATAAQMPSSGDGEGNGEKQMSGGDGGGAHSSTPSEVSEQKAKVSQALDPKVLASRLIDKAVESLKAMAANSQSKPDDNSSNSSSTTAPPSQISASAFTASTTSASNGSGVPATPVSVPGPVTSAHSGDGAHPSFIPPSVDKSPMTVSAGSREEPTSHRSPSEPNMDVDDHDEVPQLEHGMNVNVGSQPSQPADVNFVDTDIPQDSSRGVNSLPENIKAAPNQQARPETQQYPSLCETTPKATSEDEFFQDDIPIDVDTLSYFASLSKLAEARTERHLHDNSMDVEMAVEEDGGHVVIDSAALQLDDDEEDGGRRRKDKVTVRRSKRKRASSVITAPVKVATASKETPLSTRSSKRFRFTNESTSISAPLPRSSKHIKRGRPSAGASATPAAPDVTLPIPEADSAAPQYFKNAIQMFTSPDQESFGSRWTSLVNMWSSFEMNASYEEVRGLGKAHRPQVVGDWISRARSATWRPNIAIGDPDLKKFEAQFRQWWVSLQPEWRVLNADKSELVKEMNEKDDSGSFDELRLPGKNGVVSVLAALYYWGLAVKGKNPKSKARQKWLEAVEDCHWIFEQLVRHSV